MRGKGQLAVATTSVEPRFIFWPSKHHLPSAKGKVKANGRIEEEGRREEKMRALDCK